jgi:TonB family protein
MVAKRRRRDAWSGSGLFAAFRPRAGLAAAEHSRVGYDGPMRPRIQPRGQPRVGRLGCIIALALGLAGSGLGCDRPGDAVELASDAPASEPAPDPATAGTVAPSVASALPPATPVLRPHGFAVVRSGAELRLGTRVSATPVRLTAARGPGIVVAAAGVKDGLVAVETGARTSSHCASQPDGVDDFRLQWLVAAEDLLSVTSRRLTVPFDDGTRVELVAGIPLVREGEAWIADALGMRVRIGVPDDAVDRFYDPGERELGTSAADPIGLRTEGAALTYDHGRVLEGEGELERRFGEKPVIKSYGRRELAGHQLAELRSRCMALAVVVPADREPSREEVEATAMIGLLATDSGSAELWGGMLGTELGARWQVDPGAPVQARDGEIIGQVERTHAFAVAPLDVDARRCFALAPLGAEPTIELCFAPADVHELAPGGPIASSALALGVPPVVGEGEAGALLDRVPRGEGLIGELGGIEGGELGGLGLGGGIGSIGGGSIGGAATPTSKPKPKVRASKPGVTGSLDPDIIRRVVRAHLAEVRACYNKGLTKDPTLAGKLTVTFTITPDGSVSSSRVKDSTVADPDVGSCVVAATKRWSFPEPLGGGAVVVSYPFVLSS